MLPAKLGSEKADKSSVDRSTKDALADLPRRCLRIALTGIAPVFRRKWDQRFESAFLQRGVRNELLIDAAPFAGSAPSQRPMGNVERRPSFLPECPQKVAQQRHGAGDRERAGAFIRG